MYHIYFMRHGRSLADDENKFEGRYDSPLTETGKKQAAKTSAYFHKQSIHFDKIITSPLIRAKETANIINKTRQLPLIELDLLMEKDNGILAGQLKAEVNKIFPLPDFISPFRYAPEQSGENDVQLHSRAGLALSAIIDLKPGCFLIISHGGILNSIIRNILGTAYPVNNSGYTFHFKDNSVLQIDYDEEKHFWRIISFNEQ